jgi:hypothetical protein
MVLPPMKIKLALAPEEPNVYRLRRYYCLALQRDVLVDEDVGSYICSAAAKNLIGRRSL